MSLIRQRFSEAHDWKPFTCGEAAVDGFLRNEALERDDIETWVIVPEATPTEIVAFYALFPQSSFYEAAGYSAEDTEPTLWIEWLRVRRESQGQGIGRRILLAIMREAVRIADQQIRSGQDPIADVGLFALTDRVLAWYLTYGFEPMPNSPKHLLLPVATLRQLPLPLDPF